MNWNVSARVSRKSKSFIPEKWSSVFPTSNWEDVNNLLEFSEETVFCEEN